MSSQKHNDDPNKSRNGKVRVDRWLWAARFFKTRSLAHTAIKGGKVEINGAKAKPASGLTPGDRLQVTKGQQVFEVDIDAVSDKRGSATNAEGLYTETEASKKRRAQEAEARRITRNATPTPRGRPDRRDREALRQFKQNR